VVDEGRKLIPPEKSAEESRGKKLIAALRRDFDRFKKGDAVIRQEMQRLLEVHRGTGVPIVDGVVMSSSRTRKQVRLTQACGGPKSSSGQPATFRPGTAKSETRSNMGKRSMPRSFA
jgi:hypothetical protein